MSKKQGFSLIELMVTIGLVALLATLGTAAYSRYMIKTQVTEALQIFGQYTGQFQALYNTLGTIPSNAQMFPSGGTTPSGWYGLTLTTAYTTEISYNIDRANKVRFLVGFSSATASGLAGLYLEMAGVVDTTGLWTWTCGTWGYDGAHPDSFPAWKLLPIACQYDLSLL
jgi:prepilin-type N-terminal cleavage/methylation domain-containing protein